MSFFSRKRQTANAPTSAVTVAQSPSQALAQTTDAQEKHLAQQQIQQQQQQQQQQPQQPQPQQQQQPLANGPTQQQPPAATNGPTNGSPQNPTQPTQRMAYPWSARRLQLPPPTLLGKNAPQSTAPSPSPFPRYGHSLPSSATSAGELFLFGGLVRDTVRNDLYIFSTGDIAATLLQTGGEVPSPRVGHASGLVSSVLIVWGGDTKTDTKPNTSETQDDGLYLLNLVTREWTRISVHGPAPAGRYGHAVTMLGTRFFVFGGQVDGEFLNDLWAFDPNSLKSKACWECIKPSSSTEGPACRTGHTCISYGDRIFMFGGTDGQYHYNDTWAFDVNTRQWTELKCIGYIPSPREGHAAAIVDDVIYVFGGRGVDGSALGDLVAFKISNQRWYMFQNMGPAPSIRSRHAMASVGRRVFILGGESSTPGKDVDDPDTIHVLDTKHIKYPEGAPGPQNATRRPSSAGQANQQQQQQPPLAQQNSSAVNGARAMSPSSQNQDAEDVRRAISPPAQVRASFEPNDSAASPQIAMFPLPSDLLVGNAPLPPPLAETLQSQSQGPAEAQTILTGCGSAPPSDDVWGVWWDENTKEIAPLLEKHPNFDAKCKMECSMLVRSVKIYQRLVVCVCVLRYTLPGFIGSLRETILKWESWNDLQWLANHHIVRKTLWEKLDVGGTRLDDYACNLQRILDFDMDVIQKRVMTVLDDRQVKKNFLDLCQSDPIPIANLLQTLIDRNNLPPESQAKLVRTLARLAKSSRCYPNCLILTTIRRTGTDPVAGGGFADVWKGYIAEKPVALKALRIYKQSLREKVLKEFSHEAVIWRQLKHRNILPFYGVFTGDEYFDRLCLVSPWMDAGNVIDYLNAQHEGNRLSLLSDVAQGLEYLHLFQPPIIHGDLKGANIFVTSSLTACLGDFGLARFRDSQESTLGATTGHTTGTLRWQAPELLSIYGDEPRSEQCDIYSFGCVCLEVMTGKPPFMEIRKEGAVMRAILDRQTPQRPVENVLELGLDDRLWTFMQQCWNFDPESRPKTGQLVEHFKAHQRESNEAAETNADVSHRPCASLDQYGFPDHFVMAVSTAKERNNTVESGNFFRSVRASSREGFRATASRGGPT